MNRVKKFAYQIGIPVLAFVFPLAVSAQIAQPPGGVTAPGQINNINQIFGNAGIICTIINWIFWLLIVLTIIFVLIAAFKYLTAAGNEEKVKSAGSTLLYAAIAVVVAIIAKGFPYIISSFFATGIGNVC